MTDKFNPLAQSVADLMKADGLTSDDLTTSIVLAYAEEHGRRIAKMQTMYNTNEKYRDFLNRHVLELLAS